MNKTTRKWLLAGFLLVFCGLLAVTVHRSITFELGNRPSYTISERDQQRPNGIMVFCYHRILDDNQVVKVDEKLSSNSQFHDFNVNVSDFKKQMNYLAADSRSTETRR